MTSGSTGEPRPIALSTAQLVFSAFGSALRLGHQGQDRWICALPLHHVGGLSILMRCAWAGTTVSLHTRFDAEKAHREIEAGQSTMISVVPAMLEQLLNVRKDTPFPASLRVILMGGAPPSDALLKRCEQIGAPLAVSWGMTEAASQIATTSPSDRPTPEAGYPSLPFARVRH